MSRTLPVTFGHAHSTVRPGREQPAPRIPTATHVVGLRFAFPRPTIADVHVVDGSGRRVRTLASGELGAGEHECGWDGFDDSGSRCTPGNYVLRLETGGGLLTSRIVSLG